MQPIRNHSQYWLVFFMFFELVCAFFIMNLFCGVVIDNFLEMKEIVGGNALLTGEASESAVMAVSSLLLSF